jgi:hypothetical protein
MDLLELSSRARRARLAFRCRLAAAGGLALTLASVGARAQNLRDVPLGGRTASMGGAGVAAGTDSAMPYLNPAGIAGIPHDLFSLSASAYAYSHASVPRFFRAGAVDPALGTDLVVEEERLSIDQFLVVPSAAGYFFRLGGTAGELQHVASIAVIATAQNDYTTEGSFRARTSLARLQEDFSANESFRQILAGPSYGVQIGDRLRAGASVLGSYTKLELDQHHLGLVSFEAAGTEEPNTFNSRTRVNAYSVGLTGIAGAQARVFSDFWLGAAFELGGIPLLGGGEYLETSDTSFLEAGGQVATRDNTRAEFTRFDVSRPHRISLGAAWQTPGTFTVAADVHLQPRRRRFMFGDFDARFTGFTTGEPIDEQRAQGQIEFESSDTYNLSVGAEYYLTPEIALRAGVLTDRDVRARVVGDDSPGARLDWTVITLGLGVRDGTLESSYGLAYRYGAGRLPISDSFGAGDAGSSVEYTAHGVMLMLSGAIRTSEGEKRELLEELRRESTGPNNPPIGNEE